MEPKNFEKTLSGKKVFLTGHTGFTGSWASAWLLKMGANLTGFSLKPETEPNLFEATGLSREMNSIYGDITDQALLRGAIEASRPDLIIHLAAQPLVRRSYLEPVKTFNVNVMGTAHVLDIARQVSSVKGVVCITTDKVYRNNEWRWPYRENDALGGKDPYSASKSAAEMVIESYAKSYPYSEGKGPAIAVARGGNIIGGGDWAEDRLVPDFVRAVTNKTKLSIRYPQATRPWQHVLALVKGYLMLGAGLLSEPSRWNQAWNFGPTDRTEYSVGAVLQLLVNEWQDPGIEYESQALPEAQNLNLDSTLAQRVLGWEPVWDTKETVKKTAEWYRDFYQSPDTAMRLCDQQIEMWRNETH